MLPRVMASHRVGRLFGIEIHIAYFLYIFMGVLLVAKLAETTGPRGQLLVASLLLWPVFVLMHELGHSLVAMKEGMRVRKILLHAIGGVAELQGLIPGPISEIVIAMAGPFVNLVIAALLFLLLLLMGETNLQANLDGGSLFAASLTLLLLFNMSLALFNFLPIFPMDGGRVATAVAVMWLGPERGTRIMSRVALVGIIILALIGISVMVQGNVRMGILLILIGTFLYTTGQQELQARMFVARYATTGGRSEVAKPEPWAMPEWSPETGFAASETEPSGWFERRRQEKQRQREARERAERQALNQRVDAVLDKVKQEGLGSLSPKERDLLNQASRNYQER